MPVEIKNVIADKAEKTRTQFRALLHKSNKKHASPKDVKALSEPVERQQKARTLA
jgi:hypothetical protein